MGSRRTSDASYKPAAEKRDSEPLRASIFGGDGAVMRTAIDINGSNHGYNPEATARAMAYDASRTTPRRMSSSSDGLAFNPRFDEEHLYNFPHLSGNLAGTENTEIYGPGGFSGQTGPSGDQDIYTFYYPRLGNLMDITIAIFHVADFGIQQSNPNAAGSIRIGRTGGTGRDSGPRSGRLGPNRHSHFELWNGGNGYLRAGGARDAARTPFVRAFCP